MANTPMVLCLLLVVSVFQVANSQRCNGTDVYTHDGPGSVQVTEANSTHPARIRCRVERAAGNNDDLVYNPYLQLLSTEHPVETVRSTDISFDIDNSTSYEIVYTNSTNSSHYLEFEYDVYMHQESTDYTLAMCGTRISNRTTGKLIIYCWAETYMYTLIRYNPVDPPGDTVTETTPPTPPTTTSDAVPMLSTGGIRAPTVYGLSSGMAIVILIAVIQLIVILFLVQKVYSGQANGVTAQDARNEGEVHENEAKERESEDDG